MGKNSSVAVALLLATPLVLAPGSTARAYTVCEDLTDDTVVTGEMRYTTTSGSDGCYANQYYDSWGGNSGDELSLLCSGQPGATPNGFTTFGTFAVHDDYTDTDGSNVLFTYQISELYGFECSESVDDACANQNYASHSTATWRVNSYDTYRGCSQNDCLLHAGKLLAIEIESSIMGFESFGDVDTAGGCNQDDLGCFLTHPDACDQILDI